MQNIMAIQYTITFMQKVQTDINTTKRRQNQFNTKTLEIAFGENLKPFLTEWSSSESTYINTML